MQLTTERLALRELELADAPFILRLLNEPSFHQHIGDKGVRDLDGARRYLQEGPRASYEQHGFGLWHVGDREQGGSMGMCGLLQRQELELADLGFAFLPEFWGQGYALEAAATCMEAARQRFGMSRVAAIVSPGNAPSVRLLSKLGFRYQQRFRFSGEAQDCELYEAGAELGSSNQQS